jgi:4,5-DOPA dioxygenase extradiol
LTVQPSLFLSHGAPNLILREDETCRFFRQLGNSLARPSAIVCISAHWDTEAPMTGGAALPSTIHDFFGFEDELYQMRYPCPGEPAVAGRIADMLTAAAGSCVVSEHRGIDHGAWVPLALMFPQADIPVIQVSIQTSRDTRHHYRIGEALAPLRGENVLIIGSGGATHNLREFGRYPIDADPVGYARDFDDWLADRIGRGRVADLLDYRSLAPDASRNHPSEDHILPLFAPLGAAGQKTSGARIHHRIEYGILSMAAFAWGM